MPHRSRLAGFIIDCQVGDLDAAADFLAQALGCTIADRDAGDVAPTGQRFCVVKMKYPERGTPARSWD